MCISEYVCETFLEELASLLKCRETLVGLVRFNKSLCTIQIHAWF